MTKEQYNDIQRLLIEVACALASLHDPLYTCGMHKSPGYVLMANGLEMLRADLAKLKPVIGAKPAKL